ncbi:MurR/RpiR family transcriptional regulator [Anaerosinus massiliensis]|uniref:MurR/RpiR family transcriptional regulator n=1 Tax=Massilibacillus massiliensis TaxID=1806837 RepID=UPI000DA622B8|nr:MurR/RpiR family transcriptional regulator [Massilibacillus massiliensis]
MEKSNILDKLKEQEGLLTKSQKIISQYLIEHYEEVAMMSAVEFGEKVNVSDATISRFVRSIGFANFYEFKNYLREQIKNFDSPYKRVVKLPDLAVEEDAYAATKELLIKIGTKDLQNLTHLMEKLDILLLERAVHAIHHARTIYLMGLGSSSTLIDFFILHLRRMGFRVIPVSEGGNYNLEKMIGMDATDLLIATTFPRYSKATYDAIVYAKKKQATVLTIMDSNFSAISSYSDIVIPLETDNITFFNSLVVPMALGNWIIMMLFAKDKERIQENVRENTNNTVLLNTKI